jgi:hypothetical protein
MATRTKRARMPRLWWRAGTAAATRPLRLAHLAPRSAGRPPVPSRCEPVLVTRHRPRLSALVRAIAWDQRARRGEARRGAAMHAEEGSWSAAGRLVQGGARTPRSGQWLKALAVTGGRAEAQGMLEARSDLMQTGMRKLECASRPGGRSKHGTTTAWRASSGSCEPTPPHGAHCTLHAARSCVLHVVCCLPGAAARFLLAWTTMANAFAHGYATLEALMWARGYSQGRNVRRGPEVDVQHHEAARPRVVYGHCGAIRDTAQRPI